MSKMLVVVFCLVTLSGCTYIEPGCVGIVVNKYGTQRGVEDFPIKTGKIFYNPWTEDIYEFPTYLQTVVWTKSLDEGSPVDESITFNSSEGATVNSDISISYGFVPEKVPSLFIEFKKTPEEITKIYMRSQIRDAFSRLASKMKVTSIYGEGKQQLLIDVKKDLNENLGPKGFKFDMISFVGEMRVDDLVEKSINMTIQATQKAIEAENKIRQSEAEARQKIAEASGEATAILTVAKAQAEANEMVNKSLTKNVIQYKIITKWNGILPMVTGGTMPLVDIPVGGEYSAMVKNATSTESFLEK